MRLGDVARASGYSCHYFAELDSTNSEAMRRARQTMSGDTASRQWIMAGEQAAGRGRLGRPWVSQPGNLYASLLLVDEVSPAQAAQLGFVTGVALAKALVPFLPAGQMPALKWPNDLLCDGAKVAGILLEGSTLPDGSFACVIGCGVNCSSHPDNTSYATSNLAASGAPAEPDQVMQRLSDTFAEWFDIWRASDGFSRVRMAWLSHAAHIGQTIQVMAPAGPSEGIFETIDAHGRLVLRTASGELIIDTGDVMLPSQTSGAVAPGTTQ